MKKILFSLFMLCSMTAAWAIPIGDGTYIAATLSELQAAINGQLSDGTSTAVIKLTADIYLNDCPELCRTFTGTLDGDGHTIYAGNENTHRDGVIDHGKYLFTYSEGATFKNLTFKDFRADTDEHSNWSFLTSQASKGCVFENITFDHVSLWAKVDKGGAVAGYANGCTFKNITVKNGDFTVNGWYAGAVVGYAERCTFTNIKVSKCDVTTDEFNSGGVVGNSIGCTFQDIEINECNITTHDRSAGGISGESQTSRFINCKVDDQTGIFAADGDYIDTSYAEVGGIIGWSVQDECIDCINSAFIAANGLFAGGIIGRAVRTVNIQNCVNTGMVVCVEKSDASDLYNKYKKKELAYDVKHYNGVEYYVRYLNSSQISDYVSAEEYFGGLVGGSLDLTWWGSKIENSANIGTVYSYYTCSGIIGFCTMISGCPMYIRNCLADFKTGGTDDIHGIHATNEAPIYIQNCLVVNSTGTPGIPSYGATVPLGNLAASVEEYERLYCNYTLIPNVNINGTKSSTNEDLLSGALVSKLGAAWEQNIGIDAYPTPTGNGGLIFADNLDADKYTYAGSTSNVTIKRTFADDGWYSLCLPFSLTAEQTAEKFAQVAEFSEVVGNTYKFTTVNSIEAGKPYIVKVKTTLLPLENPKFANVTIAANVTADKSGAFVGVLKPTEVNEGDLAIGSKTTVNPMNAGTIKAFRAYFPQSSNNAAKTMYFTVDDGEATVVQSPIETTDYKLQTTSSFNLAGQKVDENYRGIVIKNGKKYLNK